MKKNGLLIVLFLLTFQCGFSQSTNIDFETGDISGWTFKTGTNANSAAMTITNSYAGVNYSVITAGAAEVSGLPISMTSPLGGKFIRIGKSIGPDDMQANTLSQTFSVTPSASALALAYSFILQKDDGAHDCSILPYFYCTLKDASGNVIPNTSRYVLSNNNSCSSGDPSFTTAGIYQYKSWVSNSFDLSSYVGSLVTLEVISASCTQGGHNAYAYFDATMCNNAFTPSIMTINGNSYPLLSSQNFLAVCGTPTTNLVAPPGALSYSWSGPGVYGLPTQSVSLTQPGVYHLVMDKASACSNTTSVTFTVNSPPTLSVTASTTSLCPGGNASLTATGANNYYWSPYPFTVTTSSANAVGLYKPTISGTYTIIGVSANGCSDTVLFNMIVLATPSLAVTGTNTICTGSSTTLTATGANIYRWNTSATTNSIAVSPTVTTNYVVTGTLSSTGCTSSRSFPVTVHTNSVTVSPASPSVCIGSSVTVAATGAFTYTWSNMSNSVSTQYSPSATSEYTLNATNACGFVSKIFTVTVMPLPTITITPPSTVCAGVTFQLGVSGGASYTLSPGSQTTTGIFFNTTIAGPSQSYTVQGKSSFGCVNTTTMDVMALPLPPVTVVGTASAICSGQTVTLTVSGAPTYTWVTGATTPTIAVSPTISLNYPVTGTGSNGCKATVPSFIVVTPGAPVFALSPATPSVCANTNVFIPVAESVRSVSFSCSDTNVSFRDSTFSARYLALAPVPPASNIYTITGSNMCGTTTKTVMIVTSPYPSVSVSGPDSAYVFADVLYSAAGANSYQWSVSGNAIKTTSTSTTCYMAPNLFPGSYTVSCTGILNGCASTATIATRNLQSPATGGSLCLLPSSAAAAMAINPEFIVVADFNNDGKPDVAGVGIKLATAVNTGTTFASTQYTFSTPPRCLGSGDFNTDGYPDLVTVNNTAGKLCILQGSATGSFTPVTLNMSASASYVVVDDFNNDGKPDIALSGSAAGVSVLLGTGTGSFNPVAGTGLSGQCLVSTDLNGDGNKDLVIGYNLAVNGINVYIGSGTGTFTYGGNCNAANDPRSLVAGDFNEDGKQDIAALNYSSGSVSILLGTGTGSLLPYAQFPAGSSAAQSLNGADYNGDGHMDLALNNTSANRMSVLLGNGHGLFDFPLYFGTPLPSGPSAIATADFNNDSKPDIALCDFSYNVTRVLLNSAAPVLTVSPQSATICHGDSISISLTGATTYTWNTAQTSASITVKPPATTVYSVSAKSTNGCLTSAQSTITVLPLPTITINGPSAACLGSAVNLISSGAATYTWSTWDLTAAINVSPTSNTLYTVLGVDANNCRNIQTHSVTVGNSSPTISVSNGLICSGENFTITPTGANTYSYSGGTNIVNPAVSTIYTVTGADANNCTGTQTVYVTVNPSPVITANSGSICAGESFTIIPGGADTYTYSGGSDIVSPAATTVYTISGSASNNCTGTQTVNVVVNPLPTIMVNNGVICSGTSFTITPSGGLTYTYSSGSDIITPLSNITVTVTGTDANGCTDAIGVVSSVSVNALPVVTITGANTVCIGNNASLTANGADTYTWSTGETTGNIVTSPSVTTTYTLTGTDSNNCQALQTITVVVNSLPVITANSGTICSGQSFTIMPSGANTYTYSGGSDVVSPSASTIYTVTGTDLNNCSGTQTADITVNLLPVVSATSTSSLICVGETATLTANGAASYTWSTASNNGTVSVSPSVTTDYTVTGTDVNGCENTAVVTQHVDLCTGIALYSVVETVMIYPNPAQDILNIQSDVEINRVELVAVTGQVLISEPVGEKTHRLNVEGLANGVYFIKVYSGSKQVVLKKLVIQK
jgi:hypothetical protein